MRRKRKSPTLGEKLGATLLLLKRVDGDGNLVPLLPKEIHDKVAGMSPPEAAKYLNSSVDWDHYPVAFWAGGTNHPNNLQPLPPAEHKIKSNKIDKPTSAKSKRLSEGQEAFRQKLLAKVGQGTPESSRVEKGRRKAVLPGTKASGLRKKMDGKVERRK